MNNLKLLLVTGFNDEQKYSIDIEEAHKAYYLFSNPHKRGIFKNGLALEGKQINQIIPDWHGIMGWNRTHKLDTDDHEEIRSKGIGAEIKSLMGKAKDVAIAIDGNPAIAEKTLTECIAYLQIGARPETKSITSGLADKMRLK